VHEKDRYTVLLHDCMVEYVKNEHTLSKDVCSIIEERERCSESIRQSCLKAERDNRISPEECARQRWLTESEWVAVYNRVAGSTWTLLTLCCVTLLGGMYFLVQYWTAENSHKRMVDRFGDLFMQQPRLSSFDQRHRIKARRHSSEEED
jgi:hypothetical protein